MVLALGCAPALALGPPALRFNGTRVSLGVQTFGDLFPASSERVPNDGRLTQMSIYTGARVLVAIDLSEVLALAFQVDGGYVASGRQPGLGRDGMMSGTGVGVEYLVSRLPVQFCARLRFQFVVSRWARNSFGTLAPWTLQLQVGARVWRVVELSVLVGEDYAGGFAPGIGLALGYF